MDLKLDIKSITVLLTDGTDLITLHLNAESAFPEMKYAPTMKMEARQNYGVEYCKKTFNIEPEVKNVRVTKKG